jgi:GNAT superfamily N-acetyltransferase
METMPVVDLAFEETHEKFHTPKTVTCINIPANTGTNGEFMGEIRFRTMTRNEVQKAVSWAADEGWNPGLSDADCFFKTDPEGFFCAEREGKIVGTMSVVNYDDRFSFAGLYIVDPAYRAHGIGMQLYHYAMAHAGSRIVGADGVVAMVDKYQEDGGLFLHYNNARYEGTGGGKMPEGLVSVRDVGFEELAAYDTAHFPARRENFLRCWIGQKEHVGFAKTRDDGKIVGYGVRRRCQTGHKIGPLFARDRATAELILNGLIAGIPGELFYLDIPVPNTGAVAMVDERGLIPVFRTARLYSTHSPVPLPLDEIFGVTTFELG